LHLDSGSIAKFQREQGAMSYKFQFINMAGFNAVNYGMFQLAHGYRDRGLEACAELRVSTEHEHFH
jgi:isocitrate lyase